MKPDRQYYIDYFSHMEKEHLRIPLGGMAWDDVNWHLYEAVDKYKLFSRHELAEMFPYLL